MEMKMKLRGELEYRILKNYTRLQEKEYRRESIGKLVSADYNWPADWEGRAILGLALLKQVTGAEPAYLEDLLQWVYERMQPLGYLGHRFREDGRIDEQQLAGHSWLLRGLLECAACDQRPFIQEMIQNLIENLYLPVTGSYRNYTLVPDNYEGEAIGSIQYCLNGWKLSTDVGCAYISLDGLSQYYQNFRDERVLPLLTEMAETFMAIDYVGASLQTHASLSAARGILRLYQCTGNRGYLDFAERFFGIYLREGMTEHYANYNWFRRPTWTEPCAIVDSYLLAMELYKEKRDIAYLEYANRIFYNALGRAQRSNGGYGCDRCPVVGGENELLYVAEEYYEASWCCTMRGAEGLSYAARNGFLPDEEGGVFANYLAGTFALSDYVFTVDTAYPYEGDIRIQMERCPENARLRFFVPRNVRLTEVSVFVDGQQQEARTKGGMLVLTILGPCEILLRLPLRLCLADTLHTSARKSCWYGILQLGSDVEDGFLVDNLDGWEYQEDRSFVRGGHRLFPINQSTYLSKEALLNTRVRILF